MTASKEGDLLISVTHPAERAGRPVLATERQVVEDEGEDGEDGELEDDEADVEESDKEKALGELTIEFPGKDWWQCFGSAWIRVDCALLDPDPYWECGSGSRSKEINQGTVKK